MKTRARRGTALLLLLAAFPLGIASLYWPDGDGTAWLLTFLAIGAATVGAVLSFET